jgi:uncharacterized protein YqeY
MIKTIRADIKTAMMEKDIVKRDVLKMVLNKSNAIAKDNHVQEPTTEMVLDAIQKESKQIQDTIAILENGSKTDTPLYKESIQKLEILKGYLPKQLSEEELTSQIKAFIEENSIDVTNKGLAMKAIMPAFKSKADGKLINKVVSSLI